MGFKVFNARYQKDVAYLNVGKGNTSLSNKAFNLLGRPAKVMIYYDKENKEIKLESNENGQPVHAYPRQTFISARLATVMPRGRYYFSSGVFKFSEINGGS